MKRVVKYSLTVNPREDRWGSRSSSLTLTTEVFSPAEIAKITSMVQIAALKAEFEFSIQDSQFEIPVSAEEIAEKKAQEEQEKLESAERESVRREEVLAKVINDACCSHKVYTLAVEDELDELSSWDREPIRRLLKERGLYESSDDA